jgi:4-amino-4-deoxy-L-arabinose transferase-like glycosyltransferase
MMNRKLQIANCKLQTSDPRRRLILVICYLPFAILAFLLRLAPLGRYVTPDEPAWVYRSIRFADALFTRDWASVPSTGHPGVTTMWLGALGVTAHRLLSPAESAAHLDWIRRMAWLAPENGEAFRHLAFFLPGGRIAMALASTIGIATLYPLLARLLDRRAALLAVGLLAFDPFLIGHSGLLHTDALQAIFVSLSIVCLLAAKRGGRRWWAWGLGSGATAGMAVLTKSLGVFLLPFAAAVIGSTWLARRIRLAKALSLGGLWVLACLATFVALYPAMWGAPLQTSRDLFTAPAYQSTAALTPTYFAGQTALRHGPEFYAAALPFRLSPIVLVGLFLGIRAFAREKRLRSDLAWLWLFAGGYVLFLTLSAKKFDRYLLPVFPPLALTAALGIDTLADRYAGDPAHATNHQSTTPVTAPPIHQLALIALQLILALLFLLHPLTYANPLAGGPWVARRVIDLDWGEAMGETARWLNRQPDAEQLTVATDAAPTFASIFKGHTVLLDQATLADYIVLPANQQTNQPSTRSIHVIKINLLQHTAIYANTAPPEQAEFLAARAEPDDLILLDADTPLLRQYTGSGTLVSLAGLPTQAAMADRLNELFDNHARIWLVSDPSASPFTAAYARQSIESIATPVESEFVGSGTVTQYAIHSTQILNLKSQVSNFGRQITLVDASLTNPVNAPITAFLRWQVPAPMSTDLHFSLYLADADGHVWNDVGQLVLNDFTFPTSKWDPGEWSDQALLLTVPEHTPPGNYAVRLTVTDDAGAQVGAWDAEGAFQGVRVVIGEVEIGPPARPVGEADCTEGQAHAADPFVACIAEPPQGVPSGDAFTVVVIWSATAPPEGDYAVRWRLLDAAGAAVLEETSTLSPYATSHWRAGDSFESRYNLRLDPALPAANYTLALNVIAPDGSSLWTADEMVGIIQVLHRDRRFDLPADIGHPLDLTLGDTIHLRGFDLGAVEGAPGDTLPLALYWQGDGPTDIDYTIFVHLVGPDELPHGQLDIFPGGGSAPTTSWAPGQVVVDELALPVADDAVPGIYHIAVGFYDATSGGRLPITDATGQRLPNDQAILPVEITIGGAR